MTEETRDPIAAWRARFAPEAAEPVEAPAAEAERAGTVEHFANEDGVFTAPEPKAEPEGEAKAEKA